jgi:hypothetical protein
MKQTRFEIAATRNTTHSPINTANIMQSHSPHRLNNLHCNTHPTGPPGMKPFYC